MKLSDLSTTELQRLLDETRKAVGPDAYEVKVIRRELERREPESQPAKEVAKDA